MSNCAMSYCTVSDCTVLFNPQDGYHICTVLGHSGGGGGGGVCACRLCVCA